MRSRRFAGVVLAVLVSLSTAGCSNTSLADCCTTTAGTAAP